MEKTMTKSPELKQNPLSTKKMIKWAINIIIPLVFFLLPTSEAFTADIKTFFVITSLMITLIATENIPMFATLLLIPVSYSIFLAQPSSVVYASWTDSVAWISLGGALVTMALTKTGLLRRMAYQVILICGGRFLGILFGMVVVGSLISIIMANMLAKAILLSALGLGICQALDFKLGDREASAIGLATLAACLGPSYLFYTGSGGNVTTLGILEKIMPGASPNWTEYMVHMTLPQIIYIALTVLAVFIFFRPRKEIQSSAFLKETLAKMGKMTQKETITAVVGLILIVLVATSANHSIRIDQLFVIAAAALFALGVLEAGDVMKVNFTGIFFVVTCLTIGTVSSKVGVGAYVANVVYPYISGSLTTTFVGTWIMGFVANFGLTPVAAYSMFTDPLTQIAVAEGINPLPLLYTFIHSLEQVLLPYEYAPVLVIFGTGMISMGSFVKYNSIRALIGLGSILAIFMPYWAMIGLL